VKETLKRWLPVVLYCGLITGLSSIPSSNLPGPDFVVYDLPYADKIVHVCLYGLFGFFLRRATGSSGISLAMGAAYGAFDENYQRLTPGRTCDIDDWCADVTGTLLGALIYSVYERFVRSRRPTS
jgi:VanZ family protein